ncbi:MAG: NACHT domain-containing protein [Rivularia sp. (in: Bacteria)]|nr:NACHT domain-containing protein [Rivularia sp. MS3]
MVQVNSTSSKRYRGFVLTHEGLQKLNNCIQQLEAKTRMRCSASAIARKVQLVESDGIHPITVRKILQCQTGVDFRSINHVFHALQLPLNEGDYAHADLYKLNKSKWTNVSSFNYSNLPDISNFYGRSEELGLLENKIILDRAKVVALFGMLGVGKTSTAIKLAHTLKHRFDFVIWKSLRQAPTLEEIIISILRKLSAKSKDNNKLPTSLGGLIDLLLEKLEKHRCLLILDGFETVTNNNLEESMAYSDFLQILLENKHQSTVIITSREKHSRIGILEHIGLHSIKLNSLQLNDVKQIFNQRGSYLGTKEDWCNLIKYYGGNPLALKIAANLINKYFLGNITQYLEDLQASKFILSDFQNLLIEEFKKLSVLEQSVMQKLASYSHEVSLSQLNQDLSDSKVKPYLLDILDSLNSRALIEHHKAYLKLQPFVAECVQNMN